MSAFAAAVMVMNGHGGPPVVIGDGGYHVVPEPHGNPLVWKSSQNEAVTRDLELVDWCYHVDPVVDNVGDGRVDLAVQ